MERLTTECGMESNSAVCREAPQSLATTANRSRRRPCDGMRRWLSMLLDFHHACSPSVGETASQGPLCDRSRRRANTGAQSTGPESPPAPLSFASAALEISRYPKDGESVPNLRGERRFDVAATQRAAGSFPFGVGNGNNIAQMPRKPKFQLRQQTTRRVAQAIPCSPFVCRVSVDRKSWLLSHICGTMGIGYHSERRKMCRGASSVPWLEGRRTQPCTRPSSES